MDLATQLLEAIILALPVACVAWTFTQEEVFKEVQDTLKGYQRDYAHSTWRRKLAYLPTCPYCASHYVAAVFLAMFQFKMVADDWRGYVVSLFAVVLVSNVYISVYHLLRVALRASRAYADRMEARAQRSKKLAEVVPERVRRAWRPAGFLREEYSR